MPIADIGCLLAAHGAAVTIITTSGSAQFVQGRIDRAGQCSPAGITVTRFHDIPSTDLMPNFFDANTLFGEAVARHCRLCHMEPRRPTCIIAGMNNTWAHGLARELGAPCFIFHGFCAFALLCDEYLYKHKPHEAAASPDELFDVPVLPPFEFKFARRHLPVIFQPSCSIPEDRCRELREFDTVVDSIIVNSFEELDHDSAARLTAAAGKMVLAVGPVSLCGAPALLGSRSDSDSDDARRCMAWLAAKKGKSVVYVRFGSAGRMPPAQLMQLGLALVSCPWPVLWVIKGADTLPDDVSDEPVLEHHAVGGFLTHCGWGSTLESVAAGVPMATWPFFAEQFLNEKLIVDVLGIGVPVGVTTPTKSVFTGAKDGRDGEAKAEVGAEQVKRALMKLMDGGADGEDRRSKARELRAKALYMHTKAVLLFFKG
ncbi:hypothetical protein BS78_06G163000 [Paspalum vaginatum]|nr:hypothetical protein BS78_06G163000 [Paspalum vaginatum]